MTEAKRKFTGSLMRRPLLAAALAASAAIPAPAMAAYDVFLKLDNVTGESTSKGFEKWIHIDAYSSGFSNPGSTQVGGGGGAGKVSCQDFGLSKQFDRSSIDLFKGVTTGKHFQKAEIDLVRTGRGDSPGGGVFLKYEMQDVLVTSLSDSGASGGDNTPDESFSLNFAKLTVTYYVQDNKGNSTPLPASWDCAKNTSN